MLKARSFSVVVLALSVCCPCTPQTAVRPGAAHQTAAPRDAIDINHASLEQLLTVPGMTRSWAERIVRFRPYHSKLDLFQEGVLPGPMYRKIKDYIVAHRDPQ